MEQEKRSLIKPQDAIVILLLAAAFAGGWLFLRMRGAPAEAGSNYAVLTVDGENRAAWPLDGSLDGQVLDLAGYGFPGRAEFEDGRVRVTDVDCPDKVCESAGLIGAEFESAVCLPNKAAILIYTAEEYENLR